MCYRLLLHICVYSVYIVYVYLSEKPHNPPNLKVWISSGEDNETTISCFAKSFSPKEYKIKWLKNNQEITDKIYETPIQENGNKTHFSAASFLTVQTKGLQDNDVFTCKFKGKNDNKDTFHNSSVTYNTNVPCPCEYTSNFYFKNLH